MNKLTIGSCFSGIGGIELGLEWTGRFETKWQIEWDEYASKVLAKHWPNVTRYRDIRDVVRPDPVDIICGGFPCQDVSVANTKGKGVGGGGRSGLWREFFRLICELRPKFVIVENSSNLLNRGFGIVVGELASVGYCVEWNCIPASFISAPHVRDRAWIVAYPNGMGRDARPNINKGIKLWRPHDNSCNCGSALDIKRSPWATEPAIRRMAYGVPHRMDRLKCLGNAVVPQVAYQIGLMLLDCIDKSAQK